MTGQDRIIEALRAWPEVTTRQAGLLFAAGCAYDSILAVSAQGISTQARGLTAAGHALLSLAAERDRERLRAEWQHATAQALRAFGDWTRAVTAGHKAEKEAGALDVAAQRRESTRAAYVAAGGVV
jgi:hypothetical protein